MFVAIIVIVAVIFIVAIIVVTVIVELHRFGAQNCVCNAQKSFSAGGAYDALPNPLVGLGGGKPPPIPPPSTPSA